MGPIWLGIIFYTAGSFIPFGVVSSTCVWVNCLFEAPTRIRGAGLACGVAGVDAHDLCVDTPRRRVLDRGFAPVACDREFLRVYGLWRSWLWLAPVCCACGDRRLRDSSDSSADSAPPCVRRDWPDFEPVDCPLRALCRH